MTKEIKDSGLVSHIIMDISSFSMSSINPGTIMQFVVHDNVTDNVYVSTDNKFSHSYTVSDTIPGEEFIKKVEDDSSMILEEIFGKDSEVDYIVNRFIRMGPDSITVFIHIPSNLKPVNSNYRGIRYEFSKIPRELNMTYVEFKTFVVDRSQTGTYELGDLLIDNGRLVTE